MFKKIMSGGLLLGLVLIISSVVIAETQPFFDLSTPENALRSLREARIFNGSEEIMRCLSQEYSEEERALLAVRFYLVFKKKTLEKNGAFFKKHAESLRIRELYIYEKTKVCDGEYIVWWEMGGDYVCSSPYIAVREGTNWKIKIKFLGD